MGAAFVSQQYLQNVLGYSTLEAGAAFLPAVVFMILVAPRSAKLVESHGAPGSRCWPATCSCCSPSSRCCCCGRTTARTGRSASPTSSSASASASPARRPRTRSRGRCRCSVPGWRRARPICSATSAARSCIGLRRVARPRATPRRCRAAIAASREAAGHRHVQSELTKSFASAADIAASTRSTRARSSPPRSRRSCRGRLGVHGRDRRGPRRAAVVVLPASRRRTGEQHCWPRTRPRTPRPRRRGNRARAESRSPRNGDVRAPLLRGAVS